MVTAYTMLCQQRHAETGGEGGIWQTARGLVSDSSGCLYFGTGNGDLGTANNTDSAVKLNAAGFVADCFAPDNKAYLI